MFDAPLRRRLEAPLDRLASYLDRPGITPDGLTGVGLITGLASAACAAGQLWWWALALWLVSRAMDGLDGPLARRRRRAVTGGVDDDSGRGGFLDITADFVVYGTTVVGVAIGASAGYDAPWWPFLLVLLAYYINGTALLAFSSIAERTHRQRDDGRSLSFLGGLAEGAETIVVHALWLIVPQHAWLVATVWSAVVLLSAAQRLVAGYRDLT